jgi:hypothetical protein
LFACVVIRGIPEFASDAMKSRSFGEFFAKSGSAIGVSAIFLLISVISFQSAFKKR